MQQKFQITPIHQNFLLDAARSAIRWTLEGKSNWPIPITTDPALCASAGCFVSLHDAQSHRLRGCIGRLQTRDPLLKSIYETAAGVLADPRFTSNPVTLQELPRLTLEISILSPMREAANTLDFEPQTDGIYLTAQGRTGTFLPQVAQQTGWSREQLLKRLCAEKMGLPEDTWKEPGAKLLKYQAAVIGPVPF